MHGCNNAAGQQFTFDQLRVTVLKMEGMRVERLLIELLAPDPEEDQ
ncbi:hypothetical protein LJC33_04035 [Eubacteriales bacterium OttesenSCG-928-N13]|nr:hypothetical protein [Eubacteriales bacterium OttesenSCG-928-N13]